ncbi:D-alanine--poly(phosphoribitol) ligase subunit DltA [Staphylococcus massiliensis]|uniref:D-alanine--poly(Phosphoribitol) ligase subunit 1 n=1 Tax=Staphylococcus massiliensis S46 TaxID=1229783 RepID=K9B2P1_9STAP|nr:D-alanine--poly(phosphoribitol) ligase subunit DltA [Staphylococcus massiliensis]EKU48025.1 D-alanine--poly(phosphoribitol) ligase subunit 1 [Staphylococcus massiliensis S46]MCG3400036.1 D-alanine--poly(phosphoribitol) ligase subunit DltA [Staphylococcus massiliensis]MCG3412198.1 D-alanine--poly(phosphoribitol) ligase subunit DltA [Staphylococcus massiliensis]POA00085.1 D-alanine--poly(phosphoribitol) ligase subunit 1 [Staphylococcus massiliensis CCUG 55927]
MKELISTLAKYANAKPDFIAVKHEQETLTYHLLETYSNQLRYQLEDSQRPLIVYGHMSPLMLVGMIASIKAGCGYVPIDMGLPESRVKAIIDKVQPHYIWNTSNDLLNYASYEEIQLDDILKHPTTSKTCNMKPSDCVYTIFTSGSTGEPKGVQIAYDSLLQFTNWMLSLHKLGQHNTWLNQAPFSFDLSVMAIYPCLMSGGTLQLVDKDMIYKPIRIYQMLERASVDVWVSTPSFMEMCLLLPNFNIDTFPSLREFFFCGEILPHKKAKMLKQHFNAATIYNTYGPTEATVAVTSVEVTEALLEKYETLPVGTPQPQATLTTTEESELVIAGDCVSLGYLKDEARSRKVFKAIDNTRAYHTGDKAILKDNLWFITGRIDFQIKLNGYRMEIEEIETHLRDIKGVREALVVPIYKLNKVTHLHAAIILEEQSQDQSVKTIKDALKERLPEYMVPKKITFMDHLPMTLNGKVDRHKVKEALNS